jgi:acyl carrier protein
MSAPGSVVRAVLAEVSGRPAETIAGDRRLADLGLDSLARLLMAVLLEEKTGRAVPDAILLGVVTVADLEQVLVPVGQPA